MSSKNLLTIFNNIRKKPAFLPNKKFSELIEGVQYRVTSIKSVETKYGPAITLDLNDEFQVWLPKHIWSDASFSDHVSQFTKLNTNGLIMTIKEEGCPSLSYNLDSQWEDDAEYGNIMQPHSSSPSTSLTKANAARKRKTTKPPSPQSPAASNDDDDDDDDNEKQEPPALKKIKKSDIIQVVSDDSDGDGAASQIASIKKKLSFF